MSFRDDSVLYSLPENLFEQTKEKVLRDVRARYSNCAPTLPQNEKKNTKKDDKKAALPKIFGGSLSAILERYPSPTLLFTHVLCMMYLCACTHMVFYSYTCLCTCRSRAAARRPARACRVSSRSSRNMSWRSADFGPSEYSAYHPRYLITSSPAPASVVRAAVL